MVDGAVALLGLLAPVGGRRLVGREQDSEGFALHGLAHEFGDLGREAFLDGEDLGVVVLADDGELVTGRPEPGEAVVGAGTGVVGKDSPDGDQARPFLRGRQLFHFLAAGNDGKAGKQC